MIQSHTQAILSPLSDQYISPENGPKFQPLPTGTPSIVNGTHCTVKLFVKFRIRQKPAQINTDDLDEMPPYITENYNEGRRRY